MLLFSDKIINVLREFLGGSQDVGARAQLQHCLGYNCKHTNKHINTNSPNCVNIYIQVLDKIIETLVKFKERLFNMELVLLQLSVQL